MTDELDFLVDDKPKNDRPATGITRSTIMLAIPIIAVVIILGIQLFQQNQTQPVAGQRAPDFTLVTYDGQTITLSELHGKIVVINFWANWCPPCHAEAADLQDIHEEYAAKNVLMLGINWLDVESEALGFLRRYDITYLNGPDIGEEITRKYNFQAPPETFVVGPDGFIAHTFIGQVTYDQLAEVLDTLLVKEGL